MTVFSSMMDINQEIKETIQKLDSMSLKQTALVHKLESLERRREIMQQVQQPVSPNPMVQSARKRQAFKIGDRLLINQPQGTQQNNGIVIKLNKTRVTVCTPNGAKVQRAPKNLTLLKHG